MDGHGNPREDASGAPGVRRPLHGVIRDALRDAIRRGDFPEGELLPSEQDIGQRFGASRITVRHALQGLENEGYDRFVAAPADADA